MKVSKFGKEFDEFIQFATMRTVQLAKDAISESKAAQSVWYDRNDFGGIKELVSRGINDAYENFKEGDYYYGFSIIDQVLDTLEEANKYAKRAEHNRVAFVLDELIRYIGDIVDEIDTERNK